MRRVDLGDVLVTLNVRELINLYFIYVSRMFN